MVRFGIWTEEQYRKQGADRRYSAARVAFNLSCLPEHPDPEQVRMFEDISFTLQTTNGIFRTTFRNRFADVNEAAGQWLESRYPSQTAIRAEDRAVSHALTSAEWLLDLRKRFPACHLAASDILLELFELRTPSGEVFIVEPSGEPLQYIRPPFVVPLKNKESIRYPVNHLVAAWGRRSFARLKLQPGFLNRPPAGFSVRPISCVHPEARALERSGMLTCEIRSVFDTTSAPVHAVRTMNIFNRSYFSDDRLREGIRAVWQSLNPGGLWIVGRTMEDDFRNHATLYERTSEGWQLIQRLGRGSEVDPLVG